MGGTCENFFSKLKYISFMIRKNVNENSVKNYISKEGQRTHTQREIN